MEDKDWWDACTSAVEVWKMYISVKCDLIGLDFKQDINVVFFDGLLRCHSTSSSD
jgi:hypothetical protein